jgi:hypothetical protein
LPIYLDIDDDELDEFGETVGYDYE